MSRLDPFNPATLGLFEKRFEGDDCLMELARRRFQQAGLGAEMHAGTPEQLEWAMSFRPSEETPVIVHLPRNWNLAEEQSRTAILDIAARFAGRIHGMVIHDHPALAERRQDYIAAAWKLDDQLDK